jgi:hypothetical protein
VTVIEEVAPEIICPADIIVDCEDGTGAVVTFEVTATDDCDPSPVVESVPASGSKFVVGDTVVTCTATDASGNESTCEFTVTVECEESPFLVSEFNFTDSVDEWTTGGAPLVLDPPVFGTTASALTINPDAFLTFGFWLSPPTAIPNSLSENLYAARFNVAWDGDPCLAPTLRMRAIAENFSQIEILGVNSSGDCSYAPAADGTDYVLHFFAQYDGLGQPYRVAVDQLNFDPLDAQDGLVTIDSVDVWRIPVADLTGLAPVTVFDFESSEEGWSSGEGGGILVPHIFEYTGSGLKMTSQDSALGFGFWQSATDALTLTPGKAILGTFSVEADDPVSGETGKVRLRMFSSADNQAFRVSEFPAVPDSVANNDDGKEQVNFNMVFDPPDLPAPNNTVGLALDLTNFSIVAPVDYEAELLELGIDEVDVPVLP